MFLPGSNQEAFSLKKYKEEVLKDYKRITFYLCTTEDLSCSETFCSDDEDINIAVSKKSELPDIFKRDEFSDEVAGPSGCSTWVASTRAKVLEKKVKTSGSRDINPQKVVIHFYKVALINTSGPEGNSMFCYPETYDVSRGQKNKAVNKTKAVFIV